MAKLDGAVGAKIRRKVECRLAVFARNQPMCDPTLEHVISFAIAQDDLFVQIATIAGEYQPSHRSDLHHPDLHVFLNATFIEEYNCGECVNFSEISQEVARQVAISR